MLNKVKRNLFQLACAYKRPCGEAWKGKRAEAENKHARQFQASSCPDVKISASAIFSTTPRCFRIHKPSRLLVMWLSVAPPLRYQNLSSENILGFVFEERLAVHKQWSKDDGACDLPDLSLCRSLFWPIRREFSPSETCRHYWFNPLCWRSSARVALIQLLHWFALKNAGYDAKYIKHFSGYFPVKIYFRKNFTRIGKVVRKIALLKFRGKTF